jgi:hypothetical protein
MLRVALGLESSVDADGRDLGAPRSFHGAGLFARTCSAEPDARGPSVALFVAAQSQTTLLQRMRQCFERDATISLCQAGFAPAKCVLLSTASVSSRRGSRHCWRRFLSRRWR